MDQQEKYMLDSNAFDQVLDGGLFPVESADHAMLGVSKARLVSLNHRAQKCIPSPEPGNNVRLTGECQNDL